jgi:hypothetical protein
VVASNAVSDGCGFSQVTFAPTTGTAYRIAVDGYNGAFGTLKLTIQTSGDTSTATLRFNPSSVQRPSGEFRVQLLGPVGASGNIQRSADLETWNNYATFTIPGSGSYDYADTNATEAMHFYRARTSTISSCNSVGYVDITITANVDRMIANPLNAVDNRVSVLLPDVPNGTKLYKWDDVIDQFIINTFRNGAWTDPNMTLAPGEGVIFQTGSTYTKSFVGEILQGYLMNSIPSGLSIRGSKFPKTDVISSLSFPIGNGDTLTKMVNGAYTDYSYHNGVWTPYQPTNWVGESFWINKRTDWKPNIIIWP